VATVQPAGAKPTGRLLDETFLRFLPAPLREPRRAWLAILTGWLLSLLGSVALAAIVGTVAPDLAKPDFDGIKGMTAIFLIVVFSPLIESLIMGGILVMLLRFLSPAAAILSSALLWGAAHSLGALSWGFTSWWPFLIFSTLFVVWRQNGFWAGVGVAAAAHALQNLGPGLFVAGYI
jgi:membrane protease YdiL (CAAX protease family)